MLLSKAVTPDLKKNTQPVVIQRADMQLTVTCKRLQRQWSLPGPVNQEVAAAGAN